MKKLSQITESVWADIHKRSNGTQERKEDEISNLKYIKPLDMGGSVLWGDVDLSLKDGDCYFAYDEVFELIKNSEWRLPTLEEVAELDELYNKGLFNSDDDYFYFEYNGNTLIFEKKGFIYPSASDKPIDLDFYYCWTSSICDHNSRCVHVFTFDNDHPIHTPLNSTNANDSVVHDTNNGKMCVRLVKDK